MTGGNTADITAAYNLVPWLPPKGCVICDAAYDARKFREDLAWQGTATVIPTNPSRKVQWPIDRRIYKKRNLVERVFNRLKDFRRVATRYDKLARNFASTVALAAIAIWWATD